MDVRGTKGEGIDNPLGRRGRLDEGALLDPELRGDPGHGRMRCMDDSVQAKRRPPEQRREHVLTPRRIAAVIALVLLTVRLRRHLRFARDVFRHRRRLKLAFTVLVLLRQLRKT